MKVAWLILMVCVSCLPTIRAQACSGTPPAQAAQAKREREMKMPEIVRALALAEGSKAADIGAGDGDYEPALAHAVGSHGRIWAEDISEGAIKRLRKNLAEQHLDNVEVVEGVADDPKLPDGLDAALMVIVYHEIADPQKLLAHLLTALAPGGRLVVVDMTPHKTLSRPRADQVKNHVIAPDTAEAEIRAAGFESVSRDDHFIDRPDEESTRWMMVFRKPAR